jgi:hypothetical protein
MFVGFLVTAPGGELQESLDTNAHVLQFLSDDGCMHVTAFVLNQQTHATILWEREGVKTLSPTDGSHRVDYGFESIGGSWVKHQLLSLNQR